jgi:hypothetical protein
MVRRDPLFATEEQISEMVMGPGRVREWKERTIVLEREGLPRIDPLMGGRYFPAVQKFFDQRNEVIARQRQGDRTCQTPPKQKLIPPTRPALTGANDKVENVFPIGSPPEKR